MSSSNERIYMSPPDTGEKEIKYVLRAMKSGWIAPVGPELTGFEEDLKKYTGSNNAVCLTSGTAAIHLGLIQLGISRGDNVAVSSFTFAASANPIMYQAANPVFIGSESDTWNICPDMLRKALKEYSDKKNPIKALVLAHLYGIPAKMDKIIEVCSEYNVPIIEDAAEALGSRFNDQMIGTFTRFGVLSFNGNKIITTSGGGALLTQSKEDSEKARFLSTQARDPAPHYQHSTVGYNYRLSNITAALGRAQLEDLDKKIEKRRKTFDFYVNHFKKYDGKVWAPLEQDNSFANRWLSTIIFEDSKSECGYEIRERVRNALEKESIESRPLWKPLHMQPVFESYSYYGSRIEEDFFNKGLCLPSGSSLSQEDRERIVSIIDSQLQTYESR